MRMRMIPTRTTVCSEMEDEDGNVIRFLLNATIPYHGEGIRAAGQRGGLRRHRAG